MDTKLKADIEDIRSGIKTGRFTNEAAVRLTATRQFYLWSAICDSMAAI